MVDLRRRTFLPAAVLAACAFVPYDPASGATVFGELCRAFDDNWLSGVIALLMIGLPYVFGLQVALVALLRSRLLAAALPLPLAIMHIEAALLGLSLVHERPTVTGASLLGLVVVSGLRWLGQSVQARREGIAVPVGWWVRFGGLFLASIFGWIVSLVVQGGIWSPAILGSLVASALLSVAAGRRRPHRVP
jgi:hypothetical protein